MITQFLNHVIATAPQRHTARGLTSEDSTVRMDTAARYRRPTAGVAARRWSGADRAVSAPARVVVGGEPVWAYAGKLIAMVGVVVELWRYPVKSMLGEQVDQAEVSERGLVGDRGLAVLDTQTGKVASAKNPRLWRTLLACSASLTPTGLAITGPHGSPMNDDALCQMLGRTVRLIDTPPPSASLDRSKPEQVLEHGLDAPVDADVVQFGSAAPAGTFFDFAPIHLITTSTLAGIARLSPRRTVEVRRYRPNLRRLGCRGAQRRSPSPRSWIPSHPSRAARARPKTTAGQAAASRGATRSQTPRVSPCDSPRAE